MNLLFSLQFREGEEVGCGGKWGGRGIRGTELPVCLLCGFFSLSLCPGSLEAASHLSGLSTRKKFRSRRACHPEALQIMTREVVRIKAQCKTTAFTSAVIPESNGSGHGCCKVRLPMWEQPHEILTVKKKVVHEDIFIIY